MKDRREPPGCSRCSESGESDDHSDDDDDGDDKSVAKKRRQEKGRSETLKSRWDSKETERETKIKDIPDFKQNHSGPLREDF